MTVPHSMMERVYEETRTPHKVGIVLRAEGEGSVDCPSVFRHGGEWYMMYVGIGRDKTGYETHLAASDDLLTWRKLGKVLSFRRDGWDAWQADGGIALQDPTWGGSYELDTHDGKFWLSYIGGAKQGYEPDPLAIGLAWTGDPTAAGEWKRLTENPVLAPDQADARPFETRTLYKSNIIRDPSRATGHEFVMFYNGKAGGKESVERIGMAVSDDMVHWQRYGDGPVVDNGRGISGDPQIVRMTDLGVWVMFYFGAFWKKPSSEPLPAGQRDDTKAFDSFACSPDLLTWTKWDGPHLIEPSEPWDATFAHKPWMIKHEGVVYHFYCAVGSEGRQIALATSGDLRG